MLIKRQVLDAIVAGTITLQFRRFRRPTVKAGGTLRTSVGVLAIDEVTVVPWTEVTVADAQAAGYPSRAALKRDLDRRPDGRIHRVHLRFQGADPRAALRADAELDDDTMAQLRERLQAMDRRSRRGPWTQAILGLIARRPATLAQHLADDLGWDKPTFKRHVRKLKELGLTESLSPGYRLSPRGQALWKSLGD